MGPTPPDPWLVARQGDDTGQRHGPHLWPTHPLMFLSPRHAQVVGFLPAMTRVSQSQWLAQGLAGDIGPVALEIADQRLDGLIGLELLGIESPEVGDGRINAATPEQGQQTREHRIANLRVP